MPKNKKQQKFNNLTNEMPKEPLQQNQETENLAENETVLKYNKSHMDAIEEKNRKIIEEITKKKGSRKFNWKMAVALFLLLLFLAGASVGLYYLILALTKAENEDVRLSINITGSPEIVDPVTGELKSVTILPGNSYDFEVKIRNSNSFWGDPIEEDRLSVLVRFKIYLEIDETEQLDLIEHFFADQARWHRYNAAEEAQYTDITGNILVKNDDGYYYYKGVVQPEEVLTIVDRISFNGENITIDMAGKEAKLIVKVQAIKKNISGLQNREEWPDAPWAWVQYMNKYYK